MIIKSESYSNGAHENELFSKIAPDGWIAVPPELEAKALSLLPFINLHIEDGVLVDVSAGERIVSSEELASAKAARIAQSKIDLAGYLEAHPLTWTDGEQYSITREKQNQLAGVLLDAQISGQPPEWNTTGEQSKTWEYDDLVALRLAIKAQVAPLVEYQRAQEVAINAAATLDELDDIAVDYDTVRR